MQWSNRVIKSEFTGALQVRMGSERFPGKAIMEVCGKPITQVMLERIKKTKNISSWILATTVNKEDDVLAKIAFAVGVKCFRGSAEDTLDRMYQCARKYNMKYVVRVGGDNPLLDPKVIDTTVQEFVTCNKKFDFYSNHHPPTFPGGQEVEIIPFSSLDISHKEAKQSHEREHGTPFLWDQPERFKIGNFVCRKGNLYFDNRWTLDFKEDYIMIKTVFEQLYPPNPNFGMDDILDLKKRRPDIFKINHMHHGKTWHLGKKDKIRNIKQYIEKGIRRNSDYEDIK